MELIRRLLLFAESDREHAIPPEFSKEAQACETLAVESRFSDRLTMDDFGRPGFRKHFGNNGKSPN